jgi:hypothetical protein
VRFLLDHLIPDGPVMLVGDDTVDGHPGPKVYGKARHRDPVRSSHSYTAWRYGHKWVVLAVLVKFPFAIRPWALPVLVDLYRCAEDDRKRSRPHRTPAQLMGRLLRALPVRFPGRTFVFAGDSGYGTHEVARFCYRHRDRLTLVSKLHPDANLFDAPRRTPARADPGSRAAAGPSPAPPSPLPRASPIWRSGGTVGASGGSMPLKAPGTGPRPAPRRRDTLRKRGRSATRSSRGTGTASRRGVAAEGGRSGDERVGVAGESGVGPHRSPPPVVASGGFPGPQHDRSRTACKPAVGLVSGIPLRSAGVARWGRRGMCGTQVASHALPNTRSTTQHPRT